MLLVIYHCSKKLLDYKLSIAHTFSNTLAYKKSSVLGWLFYYIKLSSFNKLYNVELKLNSFIIVQYIYLKFSLPYILVFPQCYILILIFIYILKQTSKLKI